MVRPLAVLAVLLLVGCPRPEPLPCGYGTVARDGECVPDNCGPGTIEVEGECWARDLQYVPLPLAEGVEVTIGQTFHGGFSHSDASRYAVDLPMPEGTLVAAVRDGVVIRTKEDSDTGCGDSTCAGDGNHVDIDHGDGTWATYYHLRQDGALVEPGDVVCAGEAIGRSGNTGWSTGPHLHFAIKDGLGLSLPLRFLELLPQSDGVPSTGVEVTSANEDPGTCDADVAYSECDELLFAHLGVQLDPGMPCTVADLDRGYPISGRVSGADAIGFAAWSAFVGGGGEWRYECEPADPAGNFDWTVEFDSDEHPRGFTWIMFYAARDDCYSLQSWAQSVPIALRD